jgi:hypothetical protein
MNEEKASAVAATNACVERGAADHDALSAHGVYVAECYDKNGLLKWIDTIDNTVMTEGKNLAFDTFLAGSSYTVVGPYMGLISAVSYSAIAATDVGTQINGTNAWKEAGGTNTPGYTGNRKTCAWSSASAGAKALSAALSFVFSSGSNVVVKGCFILFGSAAVNTKDDAHGVLWSAGLFSGGDKTVSSGDTLNVSYSTSM